jgi:DNA-binding NarL/FixJ family response regulator
MIRVIIADDHHLVRKGIIALLNDPSDIDVIADAPDGLEAVRLVEVHRPDILITDINMPYLIGTEAIERVRNLGVKTKVIVLSMHSESSLVKQALKNGARGYLLKSSITDELIMAIRTAYRGGIYLSPALSRDATINLFQDEEDDPFNTLTPREREVLKLVAEGYTSKQVGEIFYISQRTVEKHRSNIMSKLGAKDLTDLIRTAVKNGLIFLDE